MYDHRVFPLAATETVTFGPKAIYHPIVADAKGAYPIRTGIQISQPGYVAPMHWHPYLEILHILEGEATVWLQGQEASPSHLKAGDSIALPPGVPHAFATVGDKVMRLLGTHCSPVRVVNYLDRKSDANGYPVLDEALAPA